MLTLIQFSFYSIVLKSAEWKPKAHWPVAGVESSEFIIHESCIALAVALTTRSVGADGGSVLIT